MGKPTVIPLRMAEVRSQSPCLQPLPTTAPSSGACSAPSTSMGPGPRVPRARPSCSQLHHWPPRNSPPCLFKLDPQGRTSQLQLLPHCQILPMPELFLLLLQHPPWHWQQPQRRHLQDPVTTLPKAVMGLPLGIPRPVPDVDLFYEEVIGEGEVWGKVRPLQASVGGVSVVRLPPHLHHHPPLQLWPTMVQEPPAARPAFQPALPGRTLDGCWGSHGWLSHSSIHAQQRAGQQH